MFSGAARFAYALFSKTCHLLLRHHVSRVVSPTHSYSFRLRTHICFACALTLVSPTDELMLTFPDRNFFSTAKTESGHAFCTDCTTEHTTNIGLSISDKKSEIETESAFRRHSLTFIPLDRLDEAWVDLQATAEDDQPLVTALNDYYIQTFFSGPAVFFSSSWKHLDGL